MQRRDKPTTDNTLELKVLTVVLKYIPFGIVVAVVVVANFSICCHGSSGVDTLSLTDLACAMPYTMSFECAACLTDRLIECMMYVCCGCVN